MKKIFIVLLLVPGLGWSQKKPAAKYNFDDFSLIVKAKDEEQYYNKMLQESPPDKSKKSQYNEFRAQLAVDWLTEGNIERYQYYKNTNPKFSPVQFLYLVNALEYQADNDKNIAQTAQISGEIIAELDKGTMTDPLGLMQILLEVNAVTNAKLGNTDLAMKTIDRSSSIKPSFRDIKYFRDTKANYLNRYAIILSAAGQDKKALDTLTQALRNADSNPKTAAIFKEIYTKINGSGNGADQKIRLLQDQAYKEYYNEEEKLYIADATKPLNPTLPDPEDTSKRVSLYNGNQLVKNVSLPDLEGKIVNLKDYKGKILVIDFWDTGCKPCVSAFAGFERVVAEYKNTPFQLFVVDLFEPQQTVKIFIAKKGITLDVLHDEENKAYDIKGTPTKIVFDTMGNTRFYSAGYAGSTDREYYKLKAMVEIVKKHDSNKTSAQLKSE